MGAAPGAHLPPVQGALAACERQLPAHVEEHVVLARGPLLHEVGGEHPRPEDDAVVLEAPCAGRPEGKWGGHCERPGPSPGPAPCPPQTSAMCGAPAPRVERLPRIVSGESRFVGTCLSLEKKGVETFR